MFALLIRDVANYHFWLENPILLLGLAFQVWMFVDAVRRREWFWAVCIFLFSVLSAVLYYFFVFRQARAAAATPSRGFELPGAATRKRIHDLESKIHHLDKAHHHLELGQIHLAAGGLEEAEKSLRAAHERDPQDADIRAALGECLLRQKRPAEAFPLLESVVKEDQRHAYGQTLMAYAETLTALGHRPQAIEVWKIVNQHHSYAEARVQLAELYLQENQPQLARNILSETLSDVSHLPAYQRRREQAWHKRARSLLRRLPA